MPYFIFNHDFEILSANQNFTSLTGLKEEDLTKHQHLRLYFRSEHIA
jgi:PAS domain-containing protein